jgi:hypothetical protein
MEKRYYKLIQGLYDGQDKVEMETTVTYRDGRQASWNIDIFVQSLEG